MTYDVIIVGGGIAGLTSAAFLTKQGKRVLLCEKEASVGGLVNSFQHEGFLYDAGARGIVDSGIVKPMLKQLEIDVEFVKSIVTIGIESEMMRVESIDSLKDYRAMLAKLYPNHTRDIDLILDKIRKVMDYMDVLYGIENPLFKDLKTDRRYLFKTLLPWLFKFAVKARKIKRFNVPVDDYLRQLTDHQPLIDLISQHFFQKTPASFALSYFSLYLDYEYPVNGTGDLIEQMKTAILNAGGQIATETNILKIDAAQKTVIAQDNQSYDYRQLIWAADRNQLYRALDMDAIHDHTVKANIDTHKALLKGKRGGDSIYSLFLAVDLDKDYFQARTSGHCFYTPSKVGQSAVFKRLPALSVATDLHEIQTWMKDYLTYTTYEIAIPSLRNSALAPQGQTGLVVSVLMDYDFITNIKTLGFYDSFKQMANDLIIAVLNQSVYPGIKDKIIHRLSSTPLTIERLSGNHEGGITGWAFTNDVMPSVSKMTHVTKSCLTPIPDILQAGQWTFSPSGLPISILTGKIAADRALKNLKKAG